MISLETQDAVELFLLAAHTFLRAAHTNLACGLKSPPRTSQKALSRCFFDFNESFSTQALFSFGDKE